MDEEVDIKKEFESLYKQATTEYDFFSVLLEFQALKLHLNPLPSQMELGLEEIKKPLLWLDSVSLGFQVVAERFTHRLDRQKMLPDLFPKEFLDEDTKPKTIPTMSIGDYAHGKLYPIIERARNLSIDIRESSHPFPR